MKILLLSSAALLLAGFAHGQQTQGRIVYERTVEMQVAISGNAPEGIQLPRTRTDKFEVLFANNQSIRRQLPPEEDNDQILNSGGGGGIVVRSFAMGSDDVIFTDLGNNRVVEQREATAKKYLISDSVHKLAWKLTGETKTILGYTCQQAIAQRNGKRYHVTMVDGQMKREQVPDTAVITAWFTPSIPVAAGPEQQAQLPGLILALDINNGRTVYRAVELTEKVNLADIKEPKSGKKVTQQEFVAERDKMFEEMQRSGRVTMRVGGN